MGIEPDRETVSAVHEQFDLENWKVFQGSSEEATFADGHFDAIAMNDVIEHGVSSHSEARWQTYSSHT